MIDRFFAPLVDATAYGGMTTKHIMHLEKRLDTRLLNRNSRSLSLTEPGAQYLDRCKIVLAELVVVGWMTSRTASRLLPSANWKD